MKGITATQHQFPHGSCCSGSWAARWKKLAPVKNGCIAATVIVALWVIIHCTIVDHAVADGITGLILVILGVNGTHSAVQAGVAAYSGKAKETDADAALDADPAGIAGK